MQEKTKPERISESIRQWLDAANSGSVFALEVSKHFFCGMTTKVQEI